MIPAAHKTCRRRAVSLVETVIAMVILAGAFVSTLTAVASSRKTHFTTAERAFGDVLAQDLMAEILEHDYKETGFTVLGIDGTESLGPARSRYDDIDDYNGWTSTPPIDADGNTVAGADGYTRSAEVRWVSQSDPDTTVGTDQNIKRIVVIVKHSGRTVATLTAYRTSSWTPPEDD